MRGEGDVTPEEKERRRKERERRSLQSAARKKMAPAFKAAMGADGKVKFVDANGLPLPPPGSVAHMGPAEMEARGLTPPQSASLRLAMAPLKPRESLFLTCLFRSGGILREAARLSGVALDEANEMILPKPEVHEAIRLWIDAFAGTQEACVLRALGETGAKSAETRLKANRQIAELRGHLTQKLVVEDGPNRNEVARAMAIISAAQGSPLPKEPVDDTPQVAQWD